MCQPSLFVFSVFGQDRRNIVFVSLEKPVKCPANKKTNQPPLKSAANRQNYGKQQFIIYDSRERNKPRINRQEYYKSNASLRIFGTEIHSKK